MRISLIRPPILTSVSSVTDSAVPPLGLAYIAASLEAGGHTVQVVDSVGESLTQFTIVPFIDNGYVIGLPHNEILRRIPKNAEIIGVSCMFSQDWPLTRELIKSIRIQFPYAPIIVGGEHITSCAEYVLKDCPSVDFCVMGEGEGTIVELVNALKNGESVETVSGIAYRKNDSICFNPRRTRISNIGSIPRPAWHLIPLKSYHENGSRRGGGMGNSVPMLASRGCPYSCTFCSNAQMWSSRWEARPPEEVVEEMLFYIEKYKATVFEFFDLTAIVRKDWIVKFCKLLIDKKLNINFQLPLGTRSEALDEEATKLLFEAGCGNLGYAPESGPDEVLKLIKKKVNLNNMLKSIKSALKNKLMMRVGIVIGFPGETLRHNLSTYSLIFKLALMGVQQIGILTFTPYPGSELFEKLKKQNIVILNDDYFYSLVQLTDPTIVKSYSENYSDLSLRLTVLFGLVLFYGVSYLVRPYRLLSLLRTVIKKDPTTRFENSLLMILERRRWFKNAVRVKNA